jgi:aromatic-amino-acid transaminase
MAFFEHLEILPDDPILGLAARYAQDPRSQKMDLGVGIYKDAQGRTPVMAAVKQAEHWLVENQMSKAYTSTSGVDGFGDAMATLLLGAENAQTARAVQTPGGTGSLRLMAEFLHRSGVARVLLGTPTWPIHAPIFERGGLQVFTYEHLTDTGQLNLPALLAAVEAASAGDAILLHACCHNPTGIDPDAQQWQEICCPCSTWPTRGSARGCRRTPGPCGCFARLCPRYWSVPHARKTSVSIASVPVCCWRILATRGR